MTVHTCGCGREYGTAELLALHQRASTDRLCSYTQFPVEVAPELRNAKSSTLKLIGLDPGLANFGIAVAELPNLGSGKPRFIELKALRTEPSKDKKKLRKMDDTAERCTYLAEQLNDLVLAHKPIALCVEAIALPYRPGRAPQTSVISALGRVRGLIDMLAVVHQLPVLEESPQRVKKAATGSIGSTKSLVQEALEREYPELRELWPPQRTLHEHAADACGAIHACRGADVILAARAAAARAA